MLTTFARLAKIIKGLVMPRNWIEDAFESVSVLAGKIQPLVEFYRDTDNQWHANSSVPYGEIYRRCTNHEPIFAIDTTASPAFADPYLYMLVMPGTSKMEFVSIDLYHVAMNGTVNCRKFRWGANGVVNRTDTSYTLNSN